MRDVRWEMAASVVQHSNMVSWAGTGTLWKWSYTHNESSPDSSARVATSTAFAHLARGSSMETSSIFQPWGMNTPKARSCDGIVVSPPHSLAHRRFPDALEKAEEYDSWCQELARVLVPRRGGTHAASLGSLGGCR